MSKFGILTDIDMNIKGHRAIVIVSVLFVCIILAILIVPRERCDIQKEKRVISGSSLHGVLEDGDMITLRIGYYDCHEVRRGDIVAFRAAGETDPVIKIARGVPGDTFGIKRSAEGNRILINGMELSTTGGELYALSDNRATLFEAFARQANGVIPDDSYLLLGEAPGGSVDSIFFGLINHSKLIGRVDK